MQLSFILTCIVPSMVGKPQSGYGGAVQFVLLDTSLEKEDIKGIKGGIAVVETTQGGWDIGRLNAPNRDFGLQRLGTNFPNPPIITENRQIWTHTWLAVRFIATVADTPHE